MQKFNWPKAENKCSVCYKLGHNKTTCRMVPLLEISYQECVKLRSTIPHRIQQGHNEYELRKTRKSQTKKPPKPRRCSFCRDTGHTRPKCPHKAKYRSLLYNANKAWRQEFLRVTSQCGFGVGTFFCYGDGQYTCPTHAIVTKIPWEKMTFMAYYEGSWEYQTNYLFSCFSVEGSELFLYEVSLLSLFGTVINNPRKTQVYYKNSKIEIKTPVTPQPPDLWAENNAVGPIEWLINEHSASQLEDLGVVRTARKIIRVFS